MKRNLILGMLTIVLVGCLSNSKTKKTSDKEDEYSVIKEHKPLNSNTKQTYLKGIDIHDSDEVTDWNQIKQADISFVFIKATEGENYLDKLFTAHWNNSKATGILRSPYHFYRYHDDPEVQANFFIKTIKSVYTADDLPPALDLEVNKGDAFKLTSAQFQKDVKQWLDIVEKAFNRKPIIYISTDFANEHLNTDVFSDYKLWLANYNAEPQLPVVWKDSGWTFWQYKGNVVFPGVSYSLDLDYFNGTLANLKQL